MSNPLDFLKEPSFQQPSSTLRARQQKSTRKVKNAGFLILVCSIILLIIIYMKMKGPISNAKNANIATPVPTPKNDDNILISAEGPKVSYQFLKQGRPEVKIIIVDPRDITKDRLVVLGNHLRMETQHLSYAHIFVYDNLRAAQLRDELPQRATEADEKEDEGLPHENDSDLMRDFAYSRSHFVAEYTFIKDNRNELEIHPQGTWSSTYRKTIDYSSGHPIESSQ